MKDCIPRSLIDFSDNCGPLNLKCSSMHLDMISSIFRSSINISNEVETRPRIGPSLRVSELINWGSDKILHVKLHRVHESYGIAHALWSSVERFLQRLQEFIISLIEFGRLYERSGSVLVHGHFGAVHHWPNILLMDSFIVQISEYLPVVMVCRIAKRVGSCSM